MMRQLERGHIEHERCKQTAACAQDKAKRDIYEHGVRHEIIDKRLSAAGSYKNFLKRCIEYGVEPQNSSISYTAVDGAHCVEIETLLKGSFADWYELLEVLGTEFMIVWKKCVIKPTHDADLEIQAEIALYTK